MGYDVTYHPISPEEMRRWYFEPIENDAALERLAEEEGVDIEILHDAFGRYRRFLSDAAPEASFEQTHGFLLAAAQGLFRPYFYNQNCLITSLIENYQRNIFLKYFTPLRDLVPEKYRSLPFSGGIEENWCGGAYLSAEGVEQLEHDIRQDANIALRILGEFAPDGLRIFLKALRYAKQRGLGLLEATEVLSPPLGTAATNVDQAEFAYAEDEKGEAEIRRIFTSLGHVDFLDQFSRNASSRSEPIDPEVLERIHAVAIRKGRPPALHPLAVLKRRIRFWNRFMTISFIPFVLMMLCGAIWGAKEYLLERRLTTDGIPGEVVVTRHYLGKESRRDIENTNYRIDYMLAVDGVKYSRENIAVTKERWETAKDGDALPVVYLPDTPRMSRLQNGERGIGDGKGFLISGSIGLVFFGSFFLFSALGFDIVTSGSKPRHCGKYYLFRHGRLFKVFRLWKQTKP